MVLKAYNNTPWVNIMDKTLRFFSSGQTKDVSSLNQNNENKGLAAQTNGFRETAANNSKHIQNENINMKRKDSDNFFYMLWHS
ncbi:hypothetical protein FF38_05800 [Lucilia cuprina]|uniref:Uncharacterized protein n=1 Tax=Lucilia cuprina TaxID=7375 RepID=A0A0L0C035_LUCCU|nr:hypothetical protein FF38_05800 [Lucilia cuprina]